MKYEEIPFKLSEDVGTFGGPVAEAVLVEDAEKSPAALNRELDKAQSEDLIKAFKDKHSGKLGKLAVGSAMRYAV